MPGDGAVPSILCHGDPAFLVKEVSLILIRAFTKILRFAQDDTLIEPLCYTSIFNMILL